MKTIYQNLRVWMIFMATFTLFFWIVIIGFFIFHLLFFPFFVPTFFLTEFRSGRFLTYVHLCGGKGEEDVSVIPYSSELVITFVVAVLQINFVIKQHFLFIPSPLP